MVAEVQLAERRLISEIAAASQDSNDKLAEVEVNEGDDEGELDESELVDFQPGDLLGKEPFTGAPLSTSTRILLQAMQRSQSASA